MENKNIIDFIKFMDELNPTYLHERKTIQVFENLSKAIREAEAIDELEKIRKSLNFIQGDLKLKKERFPAYYKIMGGKVKHLQKSINDEIQLLERTKLASQNAGSKPKKELHNHIFKNNAFEVWQHMFEEFEIEESSRTDVKFMFEEMKKAGLIHGTVDQRNFLIWISLNYDGLIIQKTSNHNRTRGRLLAYSRAIAIYKN